MGLHLLGEDGPRSLHGKDEVDVRYEHGKAGQEGQTKAKPPNTATQGGRQPVHQARGRTSSIH